MFFLCYPKRRLKHAERFLPGLGIDCRFMCNNVEPDCLRQRTTLANCDNITILDVESWGAVDGNILMPLFESPVFRNVVEVVPSDNEGALHLRGYHYSFEYAPTNRNIPGERTLLVDVRSFNSRIGSFDS